MCNLIAVCGINHPISQIPGARLAQSAERKALNLVVVGSSPTVGVDLMQIFAMLYFIIYFSLAPLDVS